MYQNAAILATLLVIYSAVSARVERSWLSGPMVFLGVGLILGPVGLDLLQLNVAADGLRTMAEATLALVLFTDAADADFGFIKRNLGIPERLLLVGLPLTIVIGFLFATILFPSLNPLEWALLAAMLAPTDAALGKPVVLNLGVPEHIREALNLESGLNDGIMVPVIVIFLGLAKGTMTENLTTMHVLRVVAEEIGIGLAVGLGLTAGAILILRTAVTRAWISENWMQVPVVALAVACFATAQSLGGSGFIACFAGGLLVCARSPRGKQELLRGAKGVSETLAFLTWVAFGAVAVGQMIGRFTIPVLLYAVLSLTVIRMLPVFLSLAGTGLSWISKLFIGWFGPRGLASIVFAIIVLNERLPGNEILAVTVACTVLLSVVAHGLTANPMAASFTPKVTDPS